MRKIQLYTEYKLDSILKSVWLCNLGCDNNSYSQMALLMTSKTEEFKLFERTYFFS